MLGLLCVLLALRRSLACCPQAGGSSRDGYVNRLMCADTYGTHGSRSEAHPSQVWHVCMGVLCAWALALATCLHVPWQSLEERIGAREMSTAVLNATGTSSRHQAHSACCRAKTCTPYPVNKRARQDGHPGLSQGGSIGSRAPRARRSNENSEKNKERGRGAATKTPAQRGAV